MKAFMALLALVSGFVLIASPVFAEQAPVQDPAVWIRDNLTKVYRTSGQNLLEPATQLLLDAGSVDTESVRKELEKKGIDVKELPDDFFKSKLPKVLVDQIIAGFEKLKELDLVVVQRGSVSSFDRDKRIQKLGLFGVMTGNRQGVMSLSDFEKLYGKSIGSDLSGHLCSIPFEGKDIEINCDYLELIQFLKFGYAYNANLKTWEPKYKPATPQEQVVRATEKVLSKIYQFDPLFQDGTYIRAQISEKMDTLTKGNPVNPGDKATIEASVEKAITVANLQKFHEKYKSDKEIHRVLGDQPSEGDLLDFNSDFADRLGMQYGHLIARDQ